VSIKIKVSLPLDIEEKQQYSQKFVSIILTFSLHSMRIKRTWERRINERVWKRNNA
jgi:hypothetical protein